MIYHTGDFLSRFGSVLQVGVNLVVPVTISLLLSGRHISDHLFTISEPGHFDMFRVKLICTAHQQCWMPTSGLLH